MTSADPFMEKGNAEASEIDTKESTQDGSAGTG
jgi:hypothetical protein